MLKFETFRNPEYVPPKEAVDKGITYIVNKVIKKNIILIILYEYNGL